MRRKIGTVWEPTFSLTLTSLLGPGWKMKQLKKNGTLKGMDCLGWCLSPVCWRKGGWCWCEGIWMNASLLLFQNHWNKGSARPKKRKRVGGWKEEGKGKEGRRGGKEGRREEEKGGVGLADEEGKHCLGLGGLPPPQPAVGEAAAIGSPAEHTGQWRPHFTVLYACVVPSSAESAFGSHSSHYSVQRLASKERCFRCRFASSFGCG